jgi:hypothetical protein
MNKCVEDIENLGIIKQIFTKTLPKKTHIHCKSKFGKIHQNYSTKLIRKYLHSKIRIYSVSKLKKSHTFYIKAQKFAYILYQSSKTLFKTH